MAHGHGAMDQGKDVPKGGDKGQPEGHAKTGEHLSTASFNTMKTEGALADRAGAKAFDAKPGGAASQIGELNKAFKDGISQQSVEKLLAVTDSVLKAPVSKERQASVAQLLELNEKAMTAMTQRAGGISAEQANVQAAIPVAEKLAYEERLKHSKLT